MQRSASSHSPAESVASSLPQTARTGLDFELNRLPTSVQRETFAGTYRSLTEHDCQCLAAQASSMASALEQEQQLVASHGLRRRANLQEAILQTAALEARNKDAGTALELFYRLAEAEAKRDLLDLSLKQINEAVASGERLKQQGLKVPAEFEEFQKQQLELQADSVRLDAGIERLNRNLAKMLGLKMDAEKQRLWPTADFYPSGPVPPTEQALAVGMENRPELLLVRRMRDETNRANLAAARKLLAGSNVLLGLNGSGPLAKVKAVLCANEAGVRQEQLDQLARQRETEVSDEIRQALADMRTQIQLVALTSARTARAESKLKEVEAKRAKGTLSAIDVVPVRLAQLKARGELAEAVMAWHIARTKLRQAQGLLAAECGFEAHGAHAQPHGRENAVHQQSRSIALDTAPGEVLVDTPASSRMNTPVATAGQPQSAAAGTDAPDVRLPEPPPATPEPPISE